MEELRGVEFRNHHIISSAINFYIMQQGVPMPIHIVLETKHAALKNIQKRRRS